MFERAILWGLMGSGKSAVGRQLARRLGWRWIDIDREIEKREGRSIAAIFAAQGEAGFRRREVEATQDLITIPAAVVSCGGGWVTNPEVTGLIPPHSLTVWLQVAPEVAVERVHGDAAGSVRPLLATSSPITAIRRLLEQRESLYRRAELIVNTDTRTVREVVDQIEARMREGAPVSPESSFPKEHGDQG